MREEVCVCACRRLEKLLEAPADAQHSAMEMPRARATSGGTQRHVSIPEAVRKDMQWLACGEVQQALDKVNSMLVETKLAEERATQTLLKSRLQHVRSRLIPWAAASMCTLQSQSHHRRESLFFAIAL